MLALITSSQEILAITLGIPVLLTVIVAVGVLTRPKQ